MHIILLIHLWLCWVFVAVDFSLVAASGIYSVVSFSLWWLLFWSTGSTVCGLSSRSSGALEHWLNSSVHRLSCSEACGIFPDQESNPCHMHWQADSLPLSHQGSPENIFWNESFRAKNCSKTFTGWKSVKIRFCQRKNYWALKTWKQSLCTLIYKEKHKATVSVEWL